ncbi:unnamed protein product [Caenorhabditis bovis]|uniref:DUF7773 domain-containing protein n=1 Tax=Caenorhabditis bovis TaxID=2654633 RepID=A0A8S1F135_9PELO|nr:unnamed protein product [Caenorhabditis bovis]
METPMIGTILQFVVLLGPIGDALECYDSSYPVPHRRSECAPDQMCYSEYYAINRSGLIRQYYDRFCVHKSHCLYRGIDESCPTLIDLDEQMQNLFAKHHAKSNPGSVKYSEFCCCSTDLCNDVNHKRVYDKYGLQITISTDQIFSGALRNSANLVGFLIFLLIFR